MRPIHSQSIIILCDAIIFDNSCETAHSTGEPFIFGSFVVLHAQYVASKHTTQICNPFSLEHRLQWQKEQQLACEQSVAQAIQFSMLLNCAVNGYIIWVLLSFIHWVKVEVRYTAQTETQTPGPASPTQTPGP